MTPDPIDIVRQNLTPQALGWARRSAAKQAIIEANVEHYLRTGELPPPVYEKGPLEIVQSEWVGEGPGV
jgi:hypothetical protein